MKDGLSQSLVTGIVQDKKGFMWFATKDGLNKFDGYQFTVYRNNPEDSNTLASNDIFALDMTSNGILVLHYFDKRYDLFNTETETAFHLGTIDNQLMLSKKKESGIQRTYGNIYSLIPELFKNVLIQISFAPSATAGRFGYFVQIKNVSTFLPQVGGGRKLTNAFINSKKELILCYNDTLIFYKDADLTSHYSSAVRYPYTRLSQKANNYNKKLFGEIPTAFPILEDTIHHQYLVYGGNFFTIYNNVTSSKTDSVDFSNYQQGILLTSQFDKKGRVWFTNFHEKLYVYDPSNKRLEEIIPESPAGTIRSWGEIYRIKIDQSGVLWLSVQGYGLQKYNLNSERFLHVKPTENNYPSIIGIWESNDKSSIWIKDNHTFLSNYNKKEKIIKNTFLTTGLTQSKNKLLLDNGNLLAEGFFSNKWGSFIINSQVSFFPKAATHISDNLGIIRNILFPDTISNNAISTSDENGNLWVASNTTNTARLFRVNLNKKNDFTGYDIYPAPVMNQFPFTSALVSDPNGNVWLGTQNGLYFFNPQTLQWRHYIHHVHDKATLPGNVIFSLCNDMRLPNILWVGTNGYGLAKFDRTSGKCITYNTTNTDLPNNVIYGILTDKSGNLWVSSNSGISRFNPTTLRVKTFTEQDGLQSNEFNRYAYCKLHTGEMVFGGINGFNIFNPDEINDDTYPSPVLITGFKISNKPVTLSTPGHLLSKNISYTRELKLNYDQNFVTFSFTSLDFAVIGKNQFQYMLQGFDKDWQPVTNSNEATYTNLDPGTYTFKVRGTNADGIWSTNEASITMFISPPWWGTWWFRSIIVLIFFGSIYGFYRYRLRQAVKLLTLRNQIAHDLHDEIGSTLSSISISSTILKNKTKNTRLIETQELQDMLSRISKNTDNMMENISDIVWTINTRNDNFEGLVNRMRAFAVEMLEEQGCRIIFNIDDAAQKQSLNMSQRKNLYLLFKEAINNAAKYSGCKNVWINISIDKKFLIMEIKDDGRGFELKDHQTNQVNNASGMGGNGLYAMRKRADELNGNLAIKTTPGNGTIVQLSFPLQKIIGFNNSL